MTLTEEGGSGTTTQIVTESVTQAFTTVITATAGWTGAVCSDVGPPGGLYLRVLSESTGSPVEGANVTATNTPVYCDDGEPLDSNVTVIFTTGSTEWYSIYGEGPDNSFAVTVDYAGQSHHFVADLTPESATCATLYLPSGRTNVTWAGPFNLSCS